MRDPEAVRRVLVTESASFRQGKWKRRARRLLGETLNVLDGADHRERRLRLQPALERRRIAGFAPAAVARALALEEEWADGRRLDLRTELNGLSLAIAGDALLSTDLGPEAPALAGELVVVLEAVPRVRRPWPGTSLRRALGRVDAAAGRVLAERRASGAAQGDLVDALAASGLPERAVRRELAAFLLAAVDEPPSALAAAWYFLDRRPEAEERLHAELDAVLGGRPPGPDDLTSLRYLEAVLRETLRLAPPVRHIDRCPLAPVDLGGTRLRAGENVLVSPVVTHRDPRAHARADDFLPERWLEGTDREGPQHAFLPFGAGPHTCIGQHLAWLTMTATVATLARRWRFRVDPGTPLPDPRRPALPVTLERR